MNDKIKNELDRIVDTLANTGIVSRILLFGSYARGEETPDSDIDLCVLTDVKDRRPVDVTADLRLKLWDVQTIPLDLFALDRDDFYLQAKRPTTFQHDIANDGILIYDR